MKQDLFLSLLTKLKIWDSNFLRDIFVSNYNL